MAIPTSWCWVGRLSATCWLLPILACGSLNKATELATQDPAQGQNRGLQGLTAGPAMAAPPGAVEALDSIARFEDVRQTGAGFLQAMLRHPEARVRLRSAQALGRLRCDRPGSGESESLVQRLDDEDPGVRAMAWFALGQRGDQAWTQDMLKAAAEPDSAPAVEAAAMTALGRMESPAARERVRAGFLSDRPGVRAAAVTAAHTWIMEAEEAERTEQALVDAVRTARIGSQVRWRALFTLQRRSTAAAVPVALEVLRGGDGPQLERLFAVRALGRAPGPMAGDSMLALRERLGDKDLHVATEAALALGEHGDGSCVDDLLTATEHASFHVRAAAAQALGKIKNHRALDRLRAMHEDPSAAAQLAAVQARIAIGVEPDPLSLVLEATDSHPWLRRGAPALLAQIGGEEALGTLLGLVADDSLAVAGAATSALGTVDDERAYDALLRVLDGNDNGLRLAALEHLGKRLKPGDVPMLERAYSSAQGDIAGEVKVQVMEAAGEALVRFPKGRQQPLLDLLGRGSRDGEAPVVRAAIKHLSGGDLVAELSPTSLVRTPLLPEPWDPEANNPRATIVTSRGNLVFELFPQEAPVHVHNFLELARRGHYAGLSWHRVVSDFVVQGGCYRGDGNGSGTWRGPTDALRHEIGPRTYVRGSLGMPRNEDPESGGNQIFVAHRPTPHLDGRYTIFGELREGFGVLDRIEPEDQILEVRLP